MKKSPTKTKKTVDLNLITKDLFVTLTEKDVLYSDPNTRKLYYKGHLLTADEVSNLSSQAKSLKEISLMKILLDEMKYLACKKIYYDCQTDDDLKFGKAILWTVDVLEKKVDKIAKF